MPASVAQSAPCGSFSSSTMMVMMMAMTPSLKAARRSLPMVMCLARCGLAEDPIMRACHRENLFDRAVGWAKAHLDRREPPAPSGCAEPTKHVATDEPGGRHAILPPSQSSGARMPLLNDIRKTPLLWLLVLVPVAIAAEALK